MALRDMALRDKLNRDGFVIVPGAVAGPQLETLRSAALEAAAHARSGKWPDVRTLPKQFPPWTVDGPNPAAEGIWGVQGLMHPDIPRQADFVRAYFLAPIVGPTLELLQCSPDDLVLELFNMLVRPDYDFALRWHRDDIPPAASPAEELARLAQPAFSAQWNLALFPDASLVVVPGSHRRARTDAERAADPYAPELPGQLVVRLAPGDVVFYNNNILHRGVYDASTERMTLHGSAGHVAGAKLRARNVLQHGLRSWIDRLTFDALDGDDRALAERMRANLVRIGHEAGDVGYSLEG